jgi:hypothetical protein
MKGIFILIVLTIPACLHLAAQEHSCAALVNKGSNYSREFLEEQNNTRDSPCISSVIRHLGQVRDVLAVPVLIRYLDYLDPATVPEPDRAVDVRPSYPAVTALFEIGKPSTSELLSAIKAGESLKIRENAARAYMFVYRDDLASGIRLLKKEQVTVGSADDRRRLNDALQMLVDDCNGRGEKEAEACKDAAAKG